MSEYYYLISSLPDLSLDDSKLRYTVADFKEELYSNLSTSDKQLIDLFYLKFDNENLLKLIKDKDAEIDSRGNYSAEELSEYIRMIKEGETVDSKQLPSYLTLFITDHYNEPENMENDILPEDKLAALYYEYGMKNSNGFISSWFEFNLNLNNILSALTARKYKSEVSGFIVGETEVSDALRTSGARDFGLTPEVGFFERIMKISEIDDMIEREKKIDYLRWEWLDEAIFFKYFSVERLFAYLVKLEMIERWLALDAEKGRELFRSIIDMLKDEVRIPAEFK